jgi:hypothetical protein
VFLLKVVESGNQSLLDVPAIFLLPQHRLPKRTAENELIMKRTLLTEMSLLQNECVIFQKYPEERYCESRKQMSLEGHNSGKLLQSTFPLPLPFKL